MAWSTPKTWAYKETLSSGDMNIYVGANNNAADAHPNGIYVNAAGAAVRIGNFTATGNVLGFDNAAGDIDCTIFEDTNDNLLINITTAGNVMVVRDSVPKNVFIVDTSLTYVAALEGYGLRAMSTGNDKYIELYHNDANAIISMVGGQYIMVGGNLDVQAEIRMTGGSSAVIAAYSTGSDKRIYMHHDDVTGGILGSSWGDIKITPDQDGQRVVIGRMPRNGDGIINYPNSHIQSGWQQKVGNGTNILTGTVTLPIPYSSSAFRVLITSIGERIGGSGTSEASFISNVPVSVGGSTAGFSNLFNYFLYRTDGGTFTPGNYYAFSWETIGPQ